MASRGRGTALAGHPSRVSTTPRRPDASFGLAAATICLVAVLFGTSTTAWAQSTCTSTFTTYTGMAMQSWGNDLGNWTNYASPSLSACLMDCCSRPNGVCGTAYYRSDIKRCWLRSTIHVPNSGAVSGSSPNENFASRTQPTPIPAGSIVSASASGNDTKICRQNVTSGYDISGWDIGTINGTSYSGYISLSWQTCQADCCFLAPKLCTSWSYNLYTRQCWLKNGRGLNLSPRDQYVFGVIPQPSVVRGVNTVYRNKGNLARAGLGRRQVLNGVNNVNTSAGVVSFNVTDLWNTWIWTDQVVNATYNGIFQPDYLSCMQLCADIENDKCGTFIYDLEQRKCYLRPWVLFADPNTDNNQTGNGNRYPWGYRVLPTLSPGLQSTSPDPSDLTKTLALPVLVLDNIGLNGWDVGTVNSISYAAYYTATSLQCNADCGKLGKATCTGWNWDKQRRLCWLKRRGNWMETTQDMRNDSSFISGIMPYPAIITGQTAYSNPSVVYSVTNNLGTTWWGNDINGTYNNFFAVDWTACQAACTNVGNVCGTWMYQKTDRKCWLRSSIGYPNNNTDINWAWGSKVGPGIVTGLQSAKASNNSQKSVNMMVTDGSTIDGWEFRSAYLANDWTVCQSDCVSWWPQCTSYTYNKPARRCQLRQGRADNARDSPDDLFGVVPTPPVIEGVSTNTYGGQTCTFNVVEQVQPTWWGNDLRTPLQGAFATDWTVCQSNCCQMGYQCGTWFFDRYGRKCYYKSSISVAGNVTDKSWTWGSKVGPMMVTGQSSVTAVVAGNATATQTCPMIVPGLGYLDWYDLGGNLTGYISDTYRTCQSDCCANYPKCITYAYNTATRQCYLKSAFGPVRNSTDGNTMYGMIPPPQVAVGQSNLTASVSVNITDNYRMDWWGDDIKGDYFVADYLACQADCLNQGPKCGSFMFRKQDRHCWIKSSATIGANPQADTNYLVGIVQQPDYTNGTFTVASNTSATCANTFMPGFNMWGNDIPGYQGYWVPNAGACARDCCSNTPLCGSWTFDVRSRKCWLKNRYGDNANVDANYISGVIPAPPVVTGQISAAPSVAKNGTLPPSGLQTNVSDGPNMFYVWDGFQSGWGWEINMFNGYWSSTWRTCMADCAALGPLCGSYRYEKSGRRCTLRRAIWGFGDDATHTDRNIVFGAQNQPAVRTGIQNVNASRAQFGQTPPDGLPVPAADRLVAPQTTRPPAAPTTTVAPKTPTKTATPVAPLVPNLAPAAGAVQAPVTTKPATKTPTKTPTPAAAAPKLAPVAPAVQAAAHTTSAAKLAVAAPAAAVPTTARPLVKTTAKLAKVVAAKPKIVTTKKKAAANAKKKVTTKRGVRRLEERQVAPVAKTCQSNTTDNMDAQVWGWDIAGYSNYWSNTADTCAADCCALRDRCTLWIYRKSDRQCWLKTYAEVANPRPNTDWTYGLMVLPAIQTGPQNITASAATYPGRPSQGFDGVNGTQTALVTVFDNKDPWQWGGDISNYSWYFSNSYYTCAQDCVALAPLCGMFIYSKRDRNCMLKTHAGPATDGPRDNTNLVFGTVAQPAVVEGLQTVAASNARAAGPATSGIPFVAGNGSSAAMTVVDNTNIYYWSWFGDLRGYSGYFSSSWKTCAADCSALSPICGSWAYQKSRRTCWLKTSNGANAPPKLDSDMAYGIMQQPAYAKGFAPVTATNGTAQCTVNILPAKGIWGNDVKGFSGYFSPSYQSCAADCCSMPYVCQSFSYNLGQRACWLKTESANNAYDDAGSVSGAMPFFTKAPKDAKLYAGFKNSNWTTVAQNGTLAKRATNPNQLVFSSGPVVQSSDDRTAIITWAGAWDSSQYVVTWGEVTDQFSTSFVGTPNYAPTALTIMQIQPLDNSKWYMAYIQSVNQYGNVSLPTSPVYFQGDSSRVDYYRQTMTGFFDDFNQPAGGPDERKWRTLFIYCDDPVASAVFLNNQFHAHNLVSSFYPPNALTQRICDNTGAHVIARPNAIFDFTDREGTIVFDFDGGPGSNYWFLDFIEPGTGNRFTTLHQAGGSLKYFYGTNRTNGGVLEANFCDFGICLVPNVRRKFVVKISQTTINVTVDGQLMLHNQIGPGRVFCPNCITPIPKTKAFLFFRQTTRRTKSEQNLPHLTVHWDNFGFDGPAMPVVTHTYKIAGGSAKYLPIGLGWANHNNMTFQIPDSLNGALSARLHYGYSGSYISDDLVREYLVLNGNRVNLFDSRVVVDGQGIIAPVNLSMIRTGTNTLRWRLPRHETRVGNLRLEIDFPADNEPSYTQPATWFNLTKASGYHPVWTKAGLQTTIGSVGPYGTGPQGDGGPPFLFAPDDSPQGANLEYNQTYRITYSIRCGIQLVAFGKCTGAQNVTLYLRNLSDPTNPIVLQQYIFPPVPGTTNVHGVTNWGSSFDFKTSDYKWGVSYELYAISYDSSGTPSIPDYFDGNHTTGEHFPAYIYIVEPDNDDTSNLTGLVRQVVKRDFDVGVLEMEFEKVGDEQPATPKDWRPMANLLLGGKESADLVQGEVYDIHAGGLTRKALTNQRPTSNNNNSSTAPKDVGPSSPPAAKQVSPAPTDRPKSSDQPPAISSVDEDLMDQSQLIGAVDPQAVHNPALGLLTNTTDGQIANLLSSTPAGSQIVLPAPVNNQSGSDAAFEFGVGKNAEPAPNQEEFGFGTIMGSVVNN